MEDELLNLKAELFAARMAVLRLSDALRLIASGSKLAESADYCHGVADGALRLEASR